MPMTVNVLTRYKNPENNIFREMTFNLLKTWEMTSNLLNCSDRLRRRKMQKKIAVIVIVGRLQRFNISTTLICH